MYQVLVNIEKISEMFMKKINLLKNVTVKLKKKVSPDNNSVKFKCFFFNSNFRKCWVCVMVHDYTKMKKKSMYLYDFRVYPIYILIIAIIGR